MCGMMLNKFHALSSLIIETKMGKKYKEFSLSPTQLILWS